MTSLRCALTSWPWRSSDPLAPPEWCWCCAPCWCCGRRAAWDEAWTSGPAWCSRNAGWPFHACRRSPPGSGCWTGPAPACWWAAAAASRRRGSTLLKCTEKSVNVTAFTVGDFQVFTFDAKGAGVLLHGGLVSQDYGPPQFAERRSVTTRLKSRLAPAADVSHSKVSNLTSDWGTRTGRGPAAPAPPCYHNLVGPELPTETQRTGQKSLSGHATLALRSGWWSHRFQDVDQRGWNPCRISVQQTFGSACPRSDKRKHLQHLQRYEGESPVWAFWLTSFRLSPCLSISSKLLILQPSQNSAVNTLCGTETDEDSTVTETENTPQQTHLTGLLPEDFGNRNKTEVLQLLRTPLRVPGLILKVQLLSQSLLQVLQQANEIHISGLNQLKHPSVKGLLTFRTHRNPKLGCINLMISRRISKVLMSPSNRSLRSMYCTCGDQQQLLSFKRYTR